MGKRIASNYANVTATMALIVALGGSAYAAVHLGKDSVGARQIKKAAVRSSEVKDDSLTGRDVDESKLGQVAHAVQADDATTLQGNQPSAFLGADGIAANANMLDGIDSTGFTQGNNSSVLAASSDVAANASDGAFISTSNLDLDFGCPASPASAPSELAVFNPGSSGTAEIAITHAGTASHETESGLAVKLVAMAAAGDFATVQIRKGSTVSTVWVSTWNDANGCHAIANALTAH